MKLERERLICFLVGYYHGLTKTIRVEDLIIQINNHLLECNQPQLNQEDTQVLQELVAEQMYLAISKHGYINRKQQRSLGK